MLTRLIRRYLRPYRREITLVVLFQLLGTLAMLYLPGLNADIIDLGVARGDTGVILRLGGWMLAVSLVQIACSIAAVHQGARTATAFGRDLRAGLFHRIGGFSAREVNRFGAPSLITRNTNDVQQVQMLVLTGLTMMVTAPIMCAGGIIMALWEDVGLSWLVAVAVPALLVPISLVVRRMIPGFRSLQTLIDGVNRVLREQITGIRVIRAFVREPHEISRFAERNDELTGFSIRVGRLMIMMFPIVMLVLNASTLAVLWFGADRVDDGRIQIGSLTAFMAYLTQILMSVMFATFMAMMVPRASVSADRIGEVLDTESSVRPPDRPVSPPARRGEIGFHNVTLRYPGATEPVLRDVSLTARPGHTTAVIGSTGAGKTTLLSLVCRLFDTTEGSVTLDGVDVRELAPQTLWRGIGLVPQKPYLFSGTVASNLRHGDPDATDAQLWEALETAQAADFVRAMPGGLDAPVAQGGTNVSGGQRQRLCVARALVARPDVYLFDDSFSALDLATDARLRAALAPRTREATVLVVAQRVSTIIDADQILVLDRGRIVGAGTHDGLLASCPTYREIVDSQLTVNTGPGVA